MADTNRVPENLKRELSGFEAASPHDVLGRGDLGRDEKIRLLRQWEQDLREEMVAEEENMISARPMEVTLDAVLKALEQLGVDLEPHAAPTKHG
ncbi:MAG: hypothetical protein WCA32_05270 [Chromatiaceae bacterium]|jgi:hypothetical protein